MHRNHKNLPFCDITELLDGNLSDVDGIVSSDDED